MSTTVCQTYLEVLEVTPVNGRLVIAARLLSSEPARDMVLESQETGQRWRVLGSGYVPAAAWKEGKRALSVERLDGKGDLTPGEHLLDRLIDQPRASVNSCPAH